MTHDANPDSEPPPRRGARWWAAVALALIALALAGYLTAVSLSEKGPAGCGGASGEDAAGCAAVFGTKWSGVAGVPVAALAAGMYVAVLAILLRRQRVGGAWLAGAAGAILGAGLWFVYVQRFELGAWCVWCTTTHGVGAALSLVLLSATAWRRAWPGVVAGILATTGMATTQLLADDPVHAQSDGGGARKGRVVSLFDGQLTLELDDELVLGDPRANTLLVEMFDYQCPHCRDAHRTLKGRAERGELDGVATVLLPVPLNPACNRALRELPHPVMRESCDLARIAMAVHQLEPDQLGAYHDWAFAGATPRTADEARSFAGTLVDGLLLDLKLQDPALGRSLQRNAAAWSAARDAELVGGLPVFLVPGGGLTTGGIGDGRALMSLLGAVEEQADPATPPAAATTHAPAPAEPAAPGQHRAAKLVYGGGVSLRCFADQFVADAAPAAARREIDLAPGLAAVDAHAEALHGYAFAVMSGEGSFTLTDAEATNLRRYLEGGGFVLASAGCSSSAWNDSFRQALQQILPDTRPALATLAADHPVFHLVHDVTTSAYKTGDPKLPELRALTLDGRVALIWSPDGLNDTATASGDPRFEPEKFCCCCGGNEVKSARQLNVNILAFALTR
ncbi:MAG: DUF4159 domain-containing protein [Planctomycetota bacterium]